VYLEVGLSEPQHLSNNTTIFNSTTTILICNLPT